MKSICFFDLNLDKFKYTKSTEKNKNIHADKIQVETAIARQQ